jgi:hypothetical protein
MRRNISLSTITVFLLALPVLADGPVVQVQGGGQGLLTDDVGRQYPISFVVAATGWDDPQGLGRSISCFETSSPSIGAPFPAWSGFMFGGM